MSHDHGHDHKHDEKHDHKHGESCSSCGHDHGHKHEAKSTEPAWVDLCKVSDIPEKAGKFVQVNKNYLAVFKTKDGSVKVIDDICPHAGGSLASGWVQDGCVFCPLHGWPFKLENGECPDNPQIKVATFEARIVDDKVQAFVK
jgi:nitrite reductase (NADH) small subunit